MRDGRPAALLLVAVLCLSACSGGNGPKHAELVVGSRRGAESILLAAIYLAALRSYGFAARTDTADDPMAKLDSGAFAVFPTFTGKTLRRLQPEATALPDKQVYQAMNAALPEGIAAGDYATAAEDKPVLVVTHATAAAWGGNDLSLLLRHCGGLVTGSIAGSHPPAAVGSCRLAAPREFPDGAAMFAALRAGELGAAWTTTADPGLPADLVALADGSADGRDALIQGENVVPLYRRNALSERQLLALNEVAGVLDTAELAEMRRKVGAGADPQAVAGGWLAEHPLGR